MSAEWNLETLYPVVHLDATHGSSRAVMSLEAIVQRLAAAFDVLSRRDAGDVRPGGTARVHPRARQPQPDVPPGLPDIGNRGFTSQALPWLDAIHRFALSLTRNNADAAADLVQETYLKAFRAWNQFEPGTNCRAWLFRICRNTFLHERDKASTRWETTEADLDDDIAAIAVRSAFDRAVRIAGDPADLFSDQVLDERVVSAIDALPDDYRNTLVLSDLGDLSYGEVAEVLDIPVGTVKSRLFRARQQLQTSLVDYAIEAGYVHGGDH